MLVGVSALRFLDPVSGSLNVLCFCVASRVNVTLAVLYIGVYDKCNQYNEGHYMNIKSAVGHFICFVRPHENGKFGIEFAGP
jgi:hypothetical protein